MSDLAEPSHDDFVVIRHDERFGGFEELKYKNENVAASHTNAVKFFRKAIMPDDLVGFENAMEMRQHLLANKTFGTVYPLYSTPDGRKWILISVVDEPTPGAT